jgi:hypothetical protein
MANAETNMARFAASMERRLPFGQGHVLAALMAKLSRRRRRVAPTFRAG